MTWDRRHLKRKSGFTALLSAANQGRRAAENMTGHNHYHPGGKRWHAWQKAHDKTVQQIEDDFYRDNARYGSGY